MKKFIFQVMRFGVVGTLAAAVHFSVVVALVEEFMLNPLYANVFAFLIAFQVSYWGNRYWTFSESTVSHRAAMPKLFAVTFSNLMANQGLFYIFLKIIGLPYMLALFLVLIILPPVTFTLGKLWIFR